MSSARTRMQRRGRRPGRPDRSAFATVRRTALAADASRRFLGRPAFFVGPVDGHGRERLGLGGMTPATRRDRFRRRLAVRHQNADGGWGDTTDSPSNLATTLLAVAAFELAGEQDACPALFWPAAGKGPSVSCPAGG